MSTIDPTKLPKVITDKYSVADNTFIQVAKPDPKDKIEVEVGDIMTPALFIPQQKIKRWDNECNVSIRLQTTETGVETVTTLDDKIVWKKGTKIEAHFYDIPDGEGAREFEVILKSKPKKNVVQFSVVDKDVDYFYQPALTPEEIAEGASIPENVVGSYAIYAKTPKTNWTGGKEYKCGKVGHIFRPKIIDSVGTEVWGDLHIENGILSVTIPQDFLDKAVYPVRHAAGLTFGYTSAGAGTGTSIAEKSSIGTMLATMTGSAFTSGGAGTLDSISAYLKISSGTSPQTLDLYFALFDENSAGAGSHGKVAAAESLDVSVSSGAAQLVTINTSSQSISNDSYIIAVLGDPNDIANNNTYINPARDTTNNVNWYSESTSGAGGYATRKAEDPWTEDATSFARYSIYATYTAGGGGNVKKINIGDTFKDITAIKINIGDAWKSVTSAKINIGDTWRTLFSLMFIIHSIFKNFINKL